MSIVVNQISKSFSGRRVLSGISLLIRRGESVAIMGPSGAGKTTLLSIVGGLLVPDSGFVEMASPDGEPPTVAWIFQTHNVLMRRSAVENVALGLLARGFGRSEALELAADSLAAVGLHQHVRTSARHLSGGELQRVCVARALALKPTVMIADEPTMQLDTASSDAVARNLIKDREGGTSVLIATHDNRLAQACDRVVMIRDGVAQPESVDS